MALIKRFVQGGGREIKLDEALNPNHETNDHPEGAPAARAGGAGMEIKQTRLGKGVFAARGFAQGDSLLKTWGATTHRRSMHSVQVDTNLHLIPPSPLRYMNHSCEPNCGLLIRSGVKQIEVHALRTIEAGEELTLDYETFELEFEAMTGPCLCGTSSCRGSLVGYKGMPAELRKLRPLHRRIPPPCAP